MKETKRYNCEDCKRKLTSGVLYDLVQFDSKYHRYCKNCIRKAVKKLANKVEEADRYKILFDYPKNDRGLKGNLNIVNLNMQSLIIKRLRKDKDFAKRYYKQMKNIFGGEYVKLAKQNLERR